MTGNFEHPRSTCVLTLAQLAFTSSLALVASSLNPLVEGSVLFLTGLAAGGAIDSSLKTFPSTQIVNAEQESMLAQGQAIHCQTHMESVSHKHSQISSRKRENEPSYCSEFNDLT